MAKKKKILPPPALLPSKFYVEYDEFGNIVSVLNETIETTMSLLEITFETYQKFVQHKNKFSDFKIDNGELICIRSDNIITTSIFLYETAPRSTADLEIYHNDLWTFILATPVKANVTFFLTLEADRNCLIRTFNLNFKDLSVNKIVFPYETEMERQTNFLFLTDSKLSFKYID
jgi:hypothetical protein